MARLQDEMDSVLINKEISHDDAIKLLQILTSRYEAIKNQDKAEVALPGVSTTMDSATVTLEDETPAERLVTDPLSGIPTKLRGHARTLTRLLSNDPDAFTVNNQLELVVRGNRIPNSNIHDLMSDVYTKTKSRVSAPRPDDFRSFVSVLRDLNIPHSLIQNPKYLKELTHTSDLPGDDSSSSLYSAPKPAPKHAIAKDSLRVNPIPTKIIKVFELNW